MSLQTVVDKILLIDNDTEDCLFFKKALSDVSEHFQLEIVSTFEEMNEKLKQYLPDIIFLDINMTKKDDGFLCLEELMKHEIHQTIPVIMHSGSSNPVHIARAYSTGAHLYFRKPSNYHVLVMGLRKVLEMDWMHPDKVVSEHRETLGYQLSA